MNSGILDRNPSARHIGAYVRERRRDLGLSRAELARRLGLVLGSVVSHVERGDTRIAPDAMGAWARALELEPSIFAAELAARSGGTGEKENKAAALTRPVWA